MDLLTDAVDRARTVVAAKNPTLTGAALDERARQVGIGAVKYADLATGRTRDYVYDADRMLALTGNTGVYLQYAHARTRSILAKAGNPSTTVNPDTPLDPAERALILDLDAFTDTLDRRGRRIRTAPALRLPLRARPHVQHVLRAMPGPQAAPDVRGNRLALCALTGDTLRTGLHLLGIDAPDKL